MSRKIKLKSGAVYVGADALDIVEQMRCADFDPPVSLRDYIAVAVGRARSVFDVVLHVNPIHGSTVEIAEVFVAEMLTSGLAVEEAMQ